MIPIYICEDNMPFLSELKKMVESMILIGDYDCKVMAALTSPEDLLHQLSNHAHLGIYFINMHYKNSSMNGLELASKIRILDPLGSIAFLATNHDLLTKVFELNLEVADFILKYETNNLLERLERCVQHALNKTASPSLPVKQLLTFNVKSKKYYIPFVDIYFIETSINQHRLMLHQYKTSVEFYGNLDTISTKVGDTFVRSHRSVLVNTIHIKEIDREQHAAILDNGFSCRYRI